MTRWTTAGGASLLAAIFVMGASGCAVVRMPANAETSRREIEQLRREEAELLAMVREIREILNAQGESLTGLKADTGLQLQALDEKLEMLRSQLEERYERGRRSVPPPVSGGDPGSVPTPPADDLFLAAHRDFSRGNYDLAIAGFEEFLRREPASDRADDAQYWIGECFYSQGNMERAIEEFLEVRDRYPNGDRRAAATLKVGYAYLRLGDSAGARRYLDAVIRDYPGTDEARLAAEKLKEIQ